MDRYVVAGNPVEHSQSPFIHAEFARQTGQAMEYGRLLVPLAGFADAVRTLADGGAKGCNITVPFKFDAFDLAARHTERATLAQAANVLRFDADGWLADNTDGAGLVADIERNAEVPLAGLRVLLIGAGGAASGALGPLLAARPGELVIANRTLDKARALVGRHRELASSATLLRAATLEACGRDFDVVINASASSMQGASVPVSPVVLAPGALALDMMYGPAAQPFLDWAEEGGARGRDGLGMLVEQAAAAFELWRGVRPETAPVLAALRARMSAKP
ncbi:MAG: shikimate dehydrogenase [Burkholderiales bacterium]